MFLELSTIHNEKIYLNTDEIRLFKKYDKDPRLTVVELRYGSYLVTEKPEEIMEMLKGGN